MAGRVHPAIREKRRQEEARRQEESSETEEGDDGTDGKYSSDGKKFVCYCTTWKLTKLDGFVFGFVFC